LRLGVPPETRVPLAVAALAPASIRLAGELADAWAPFLWARSRLADGRELLREGGEARVAVGVPVALGRNEAEARRAAAWWLTTYLTRMGPLYPRLLGHRFGMTRAVNALLEGALAERTDLPPAAEALARDVTLLGTFGDAAAAIDAWFAAGADEVQLVLPPGHPEEQLEEIIELAAAAPSPA